MSQPKQLLLVAQVDFRLAVHGMRSYVQHALARNQRKQRMAYRRKRRVGSDGSHALKAPMVCRIIRQTESSQTTMITRRPVISLLAVAMIR